MKLSKVELRNYRNIREMTVEPCGGINVLYGDNAQGKTNFIEGVWLFTGNPSFRGARTGELIRFGQSEARLFVSFSDRRREQEAALQFGSAALPSGDGAKAGRRKILLNGVELKSLGDLNGSFYAVVFSPAHLSLVRDGPRARRRFLDIAISQIRPQYKQYLNLYEKLLTQRNSLLRNAGAYRNLESNLDVWDIQLAKAGTILTIYRNDYIKKLLPVASSLYEGLSGQRERFSLSYLSTVYEDVSSVTAYEKEKIDIYYRKLKEDFPADIRQGFTSAGVHRDDLELAIDGRSVRMYGSQGQQRSSVVTLKLAEASLLQKCTGEAPIMLLDDVMSELDESRQDFILNHLSGMQVFITCCDVSNAARLQSGKVLHIVGGALAGEQDSRRTEGD